MSLYDLKSTMPPASDLTQLDGVRLSTPEAALMKVSAAFLERNPVEAQIVLSGLRDISELLRRMLDDGTSVVAGRLAGAFRKLGREDAADEIVHTMRAAGFAVRETDPGDHHRGQRAPAWSAPPAGTGTGNCSSPA
jgi:hypothetical protein